jgi:hypothetical protein
MPTILLLTANDQNERLEKLTAEVKEIQRTLNSAYGRDYETVLVPETSLEDLIQEFNVPNREIEVLHFAGHADGNTLQLTDGNLEAEALAAKIRTRQTVKFVFLNGCATKGQVKFFHNASVPFVLATSRPVDDTKAQWLATQFYQYLTLNRTLRQAMEEVVIDAKKITQKITFSNDRGVYGIEDDTPDSTLEWGLYPAREDADYSLPFSRHRQDSVPELQHTVFLDKLVFALSDLDSMHLADLKKVAANIRRGLSVSNDEKIKKLLAALPYTLGVRLRKMVADPSERSNDYFRDLLYDNAMFFETLLHHTVALLSAKIWQEKQRSFQHVPQNIGEVRLFLRQNRLHESPEAYAPVIHILDHWLRTTDPQSPLLLEEETRGYLQSPGFREACGFFYLQKQYYWQRVRLQPAEALENCILAQTYLQDAFRNFRFLARHILASVRGINVMNFRHLPLEYDNMVSRLVVTEAEPAPIAGKDMMENKSVLSFYETQPALGVDSLNLFPFVIDRNVFTGKPNNEVDLYLFCGYFPGQEGGNECYHFVSVSDPGKVWRFNEQQDYVSLLHLDEEKSRIHEQNHLMANAWEFKNYLSEYRNQFLQLVQTP